MRGGSHGDWNRFLCSQILGAERDTMLLGSRQPSVSSSNPTKTTPGGMLPGGVAVVVAASPGTARAGLGHGARSRAPTPAPAASCSDGAAARGPVQATTGVGLRPGGRRRRSRSLGEVRGPYWRTPARRPWTRSGPWVGSALVAFRRTATEGLHSPLPARRLLARSARGPAARSRPGGAGSYLQRGPGGRRRVRSPRECVGGGSGDPVAEGCTPLPKQTFNGHNVVVGTVRWGGRKAGGGMYYRHQADAIRRVRGRCRRSVAVVGPQQ